MGLYCFVNLIFREREYSQAVQLSPNYAPAHLLYAGFLVSMAKQEQGLAEMRKALELDPTAELTNMVSVHILRAF
jgi:Tfp pilus assembly protein PilF